MSRVSSRRAALFARALKRASSVSVRDSNSLSVLRNAGVEAIQIPDLAFLLTPVWKASNWNRVIVSFRAQTEGERIAIFKSLPEILSGLGAGRDVVATAQVRRDVELNKEIAEHFGLPFKSVLDPDEGRLQRAEELYRGCQLVISNRLHVLLLAGAQGAYPVPVLMPHEQKVRGVMQDAGIKVLDHSEAIGQEFENLFSSISIEDNWNSKLYKMKAKTIREWIDALLIKSSSEA
jgi:polysaccharide pyruvyl transferase WcaK-like protein